MPSEVVIGAIGPWRDPVVVKEQGDLAEADQVAGIGPPFALRRSGGRDPEEVMLKSRLSGVEWALGNSDPPPRCGAPGGESRRK